MRASAVQGEQRVKGGDCSLRLPCVPQKPENADSDACKDAARKHDVRVNPHYHVQDARAKDEPEHDPQPICETLIERPAIAALADAAPHFRSQRFKAPSYVSRDGALSIREKIYNFWKRQPPA
jgi:hypothetical protein